MSQPEAYIIDPVSLEGADYQGLPYDGVVVEPSGLAYLGSVIITRPPDHGHIVQLSRGKIGGRILAPLDWRTRHPRPLHWEE